MVSYSFCSSVIDFLFYVECHTRSFFHDELYFIVFGQAKEAQMNRKKNVMYIHDVFIQP